MSEEQKKKSICLCLLPCSAILPPRKKTRKTLIKELPKSFSGDFWVSAYFKASFCDGPMVYPNAMARAEKFRGF